MPETLAALLLAHMLADFVLQTDWMVANKTRAPAILAHGAVVLATTLACMGSLSPALWFLALAHLGVDLIKTHSGRRGLPAFIADQAAHLALIAAVAALSADLWSRGAWAGTPALPALMAVLAGAILATRAGGFAVGLYMAPFAAALPSDGLPGAGRAIGILERGLIFAFILAGQPEGVGLLMAAKSILRFGVIKEDRHMSEYVILGTLASFGWALLTGYATLSLLSHLAPLGIPFASP